MSNLGEVSKMGGNPVVSRESLLVGPTVDLHRLCINAIRMLSTDAVQHANSGHLCIPTCAATDHRCPEFGAPAPEPVVIREFDFTPEHVVETATRILRMN